MAHGTKILDRQFIPAGTLVIEQGAQGNRAFLIESGAVEVFVRNPNGSETLLAELGAGAMVGEMAALSEGVRSASVRTKADCVLIGIPAHDLTTSMKASESLYKRLIRMMSSRMKDTNMKLLQREQQLAEAEKASRRNVDSVAAYLSEKQSKIQKELAPAFALPKAEGGFQSGDFSKD